jgi:C4-dicarboxylate-specific signal transduction histidine kinase
MEALAVERTRAAIQVAVEQRLLETVAVERAERDAALERSEAFLLEAQRLSSTGSFSWRVATDELTWSEQLYRIFEFDKNEPATFALITSRVHPEDRAAVLEARERARRFGGDIDREHRLLMPDRSIKHLHMVAHGTRDKDGRLEYIGAVQDVTRRRIAEEALDRTRSELAHAVRVMSLGALTASIAHEVNQPLTGIITNAGTCLRMLTAEPPDIEGARETARRTLRDGSRASEVITRLRALFGKKEVRIDQVDLNEATREVIALSLSELQRNRVTLRANLADDLPLVVGDRVQLQQVILNLFLNALDAMARVDEGTRVLMVKTEREEGDRVRLSVKDTGVGVDTGAMARVFDPFYTTKGNGMGIGLFVSRSIIESHRGSLRVVANEHPGVTFSFSLPKARQRVFAPLRPPARTDSGRVVGAP